MNNEIMDAVLGVSPAAESLYVNPSSSDSTRAQNRLEVNFDTQSYTANQVARCSLVPVNGLLKCHHNFISFDVTLADTTNTHIDTSSIFFKRFIVRMGGTIIQDIQDFNKVYALYYKNSSSADFAASGLGGELQAMTDTTVSGKRLVVPLFTGLFNCKKTLLLSALPKIEIEITLAPNAHATADAAGDGSYTLSNMKLILNMVDKASPEYINMVSRRLMEADMDETKAIPILMKDHNVQLATTGTGASQNFIFNMAYSNARSLVTGCFDEGNATGMSGTSLWNGLKQYVFLVGNQYVPQQPTPVSSTELDRALEYMAAVFGQEGQNQDSSLQNVGTYISNTRTPQTTVSNGHFSVGVKLNSSASSVSGRSILNAVQLETLFDTGNVSALTLALGVEYDKLVLLSRNGARVIY